MMTLTGVGTVSFRSPDIANKYNIDTSLIARYTRGQKVIVYKDTNWKNVETELFAFKHIRETKKSEIQGFFTDNLGREISVTTPRTTSCGVETHSFTGYIFSDVINYVTHGVDGCQVLYEFGLVILYKLTQLDVNYLLAEDSQQLITEAGDKLKIEAD